VHSRRIGEIEAVEEDQSQKDLFYHPLGHSMKGLRTFFEDVCDYIQGKSYADDCQDQNEHEIAISQEIGIVSDTVNP
jgi:hypothetical protein